MNLVYNASAGTGKTYQVTQLYEKLVIEEGIDPRKILLMTFTDNAAAELRLRVAQRLLKIRRTAEVEGCVERVECAIQAMACLPSAPIGTIHSFCTRLLREHALEAGLSPGFSILIGDKRDELLNQICRDELLVRLGSDPDFKTFCAGAHIIGSGKGFGSSITETVPTLIGEAGNLGIALDQTESLLPPPTSIRTRIEFEQICTRIQDLPKITPTAHTALGIIQQSLAETHSVETLVERLNELGIKKFGRGCAKEVSADFWELKEAVENIVKYQKRYPAAQAFARYVQAVALQFRQRKHTMDAIDFDDQLRMAGELLESGKATPEFDYVIVDEVQDTSRIQCKLVQSLWGKDTHLVICGDKKQSIYTWRGADPQVMPDLEELIRKAGGQRENLKTSYRSKAPILDVINTLFESVYGQEAYSDAEKLQSNFSTPDEKPCVEFLAFDGDEERSKQEKGADEMEGVANRIQLLIHGSKEWQPAFRYSEGFEPTGESNAYRYSDILILLRRTTHQPALEHALRHAGIPYTLGGKGRGLFTRQETRDVALFLNVITNPSDAYALIGFLRSPWIGLSDEAIAELAWSEEGFSVDRLMDFFATESAGQKARTTCGAGFLACPPAELIQRYRALSGTKLASELVRMLIDETGFDALQAGLPRGIQRLANLRKVLDWLRENERGARTTPAAVARKLAEKIQNPPQVPEAALLDPAQNAVTIMTVHGSKGLTKRVVFLPDISAGQKNDTAFARVFFDENKAPTLGVKITAPDKSSVASPGFKSASAQAKFVRTDEFNNLFYVAMTRARDLVITSASVGQKPAGWLKQLEPFIGTDIPSIPHSALREAAQIESPFPETIPAPSQLAAALQTLAPPPQKPSLQRLSATKLAKEFTPLRTSDIHLAPTASDLGSLGHAVLEQLALNEWDGSVGTWLEVLRNEFGRGKVEAAALEKRIESTRELMRTLTADMQEIRPEFSFVLHDGDLLIDGTIDLLCRSADGATLFDYKFTDAPDASVASTYRKQMTIYSKAAEKVFPGAGTPKILLIIISSKGTRLLDLCSGF